MHECMWFMHLYYEESSLMRRNVNSFQFPTSLAGFGIYDPTETETQVYNISKQQINRVLPQWVKKSRA